MNARLNFGTNRAFTVRASAGLAVLLYGAAAAAQTANITPIAVPNSTSVSISALNNKGNVAGYFSDPGGDQRGFFWDGAALDLGTLGGTVSQANDLNDFEQTTGYSSAVGDQVYRAFLGVGQTLFDLGSLGGFVSTGTSINDAGAVTGYSYISTVSVDFHAFVSRNGVMTGLGTLGGSFSYGIKINSLGHVTGDSGLAGDLASHAFFFDGTVLSDIGTLGGSVSSAYDLNDLGHVTGYASTAGDAEYHAFVYRDGNIQGLGTLGGTFSAGYAVNNSGIVVGDSSLAGDAVFQGFIWSGGAMTSLGHLGGNHSSALAVNNANQVVGVSSNALSQARAFLWQNGSMVDLNSTLPANSGWVLDGAYYINDAGHIVGTGLHQGQPSWYRLQLGSSENHPPVANAGPDFLAECGSPVVLDGRNSSDPDGDNLTFEWFEGDALVGDSSQIALLLSKGVHTFRLRVSDPQGAASEDLVVVNVQDTAAPVVVCPGGQVGEANAAGVAPVPDLAATAVVTDACSSARNVRLSQLPAAGTLLGCGVHEVRIEAVDEAGNVSSCSTFFTVSDVTPPSVAGPALLKRPVGNDCVAAVPDLKGEFAVTDNCTPGDQLAYTQNPPAGTMLSLGEHSVQVAFTDAAGNVTTREITLKVVDQTAPVIVSVSATPNQIRPANKQMIPVNISVAAADNCDPSPVCRITHVESSDPVTGPGDKSTPDWVITGDLTLEVKAEVSSQDTRTYKVVVTSVDIAGNQESSTVDVVIFKNKNTSPDGPIKPPSKVK